MGSITDENMLRTFQDRTLEPRTASSTTPSMTTTMWTAAQIAAYMSNRQHQLIRESAPLASHYGYSGDADTSLPVSAGSESVTLTGNTVDVLRAAIVEYSSPGVVVSSVEVPRESSWTLDSWNDAWETQSSTPEFYNEGLISPASVYIGPHSPAAAGLDVILIETAPTLNNTGVPIAVPDELSPYILYGSLADALQGAGEPNDPIRAKYCLQRWQEGVALAKMISTWPARGMD